jgi:MFS family permease
MAAIEAKAPPSVAIAFSHRHVAAAVAGNALEFYDFTAYAFFSVQIGRTFFPSHTPFQSLILSLVTFGVGFIGRPIGAVVIGAYGDRVGRRPAMMLSFILMCVGVLGLALTPSFAQIGVVAPVLVLTARVVQGFALGGEVGPTTAYLIEAAPEAERGLIGAWQYGGQCLANLTAGLIGLGLASVLSPASLDSWGWRVPFLLGAAVLPLGWFLRHGLPETLSDAERQHAPTPAETAQFRRAIWLGLPMLASTTISFAVFNFLTTYAVANLHMAQRIAFGATVAWGASGLVFTLIGGALSDRLGRKPLMIWPRLLFLVLILPMFSWMVAARSGVSLILATLVLTSLASLSSGVSLICLTEAIPKSVRSGSLAVIYALSIAVFNGTAPLLMTSMIKATGQVMWPAYYLTVATALGLVVMAMMRETAPVRLARAAA